MIFFTFALKKTNFPPFCEIRDYMNSFIRPRRWKSPDGLLLVGSCTIYYEGNVEGFY